MKHYAHLTAGLLASAIVLIISLAGAQTPLGTAFTYQGFLRNGALPKGEALPVARVAGIQAAKRTAELVPLCHPLALDWVDVRFERDGDGIIILATARTSARTGVEMEALTAAAVAALTLYDMAKSADKAMVIGPIRLESKSGGKSGEWTRPAS